MANLILIRGYPGSGKTTLGKMLEKNAWGIFIDHNAILTFLAGIVGDDNGMYDEIHALELSMARKVITENKSVIVARGFSKDIDIEPYRRIAQELNIETTVFRLDVNLSILKDRVTAPERKMDYNPTISAEALAEWVKDNPLEDIDCEIIIDATQSLSQVLSDIERHIKQLS